jgi:protein kinase-like protein
VPPITILCKPWETKSIKLPIRRRRRETKSKRACQVCGTALYDDSDPCPVCALRGALGHEQSISESPTEPALSPSQLRFEHYKILTLDDGTPLELGRGAMGVTYKALDVNLRYAVALKVINAQFIGDESAHRRFVREARAAASLRHPNVASVFHLGKSGDSYFYTMEFVEGETLQSLVKRSGRLDLKLALEIATQVASGLTAIHEQDIIHRDIKPSNVMVGLKDGRCTAAKIIDLGSAKPAKRTGLPPGRSTPEAAFEMLEQCEGKLSRTVLRGGDRATARPYSPGQIQFSAFV